jgi:hypothetical protein
MNMKVLMILVLSVGLVVAANGQKAFLSGTVTDKFGAVIPKAKVEAKNNEGKFFSTRTNNFGDYQIELVEDEYIIEITLMPFNKFLVPNYWVIYKMRLDAVLQCKSCEITEHDFSKPTQIIQPPKAKISDKILLRPLEKLPKEQNKTKRKNN